MSEAIVVALIAAGASVTASLFSWVSSSKAAKQSQDLMIYRLEQLEEKVMKHNNLIERMTKVELRIDHIREEMAHDA